MGRKVWSWGDFDHDDATVVSIIAPESGDVFDVKESDTLEILTRDARVEGAIELSIAEARRLSRQLRDALESFIGEPVRDDGPTTREVE